MPPIRRQGELTIKEKKGQIHIMQKYKTTSRYTGAWDWDDAYLECQVCGVLWKPHRGFNCEVRPSEGKCPKGCWEYLDEKMESVPKELVPKDDTVFWGQKGLRYPNQPGFMDLGSVLRERTKSGDNHYWLSNGQCDWGSIGQSCHDEGVRVISGIPPIYEGTTGSDREADGSSLDNTEMPVD